MSQSKKTINTTDDEKNKQISSSKKMPTASSSESTSTITPSVNYAHIIQNFRLVWVDSNLGEANNNDTMIKLRQIVNNVKIFADVNECVNFINKKNEDTIFMITSGELSQVIIPMVQNILQLNCIYIFCTKKASYEHWTQQSLKVKGAFTGITAICEALKRDVEDCDQNSVSISFFKMTDESANQSLDPMNHSFIHRRVLKEVLLSMNYEQNNLDDFIKYCRKQLADNTAELKTVDKLQKKYRHHQPIWWYTNECFLHSMLNRTLRAMEVDLIVKMGFFIQDLHQHIATLHSEQYGGHHHSNSFTVYRGQGLSQTDFSQLKKMHGGLLSFDNFVFASKNSNVSLEFARRTMNTSSLIGILFIMKIDPSVSSAPFANVKSVSAQQMEEEILFSMHPIFRIGLIKQIEGNNRLWQVELTLTSDNDPQLFALTESIREETYSHLKGWDRLGMLLITIGQFNKAEDLYKILLEQITNDVEKAHIFYQLGYIKDQQQEYLEAITFYKNSIKINQKILSSSHPNLAAAYDNIGLLYTKMSEYSKALSYYEKALEIRQQTLPANHPQLTTSYNNIGSVYEVTGQYSKALSYYEKALEIYQKTLPPNHPHFATSYNNIGLVYDNMGEHSKALSSHEKALELRQQNLPPDHPHMATSYNNIGLVYANMGEYSKARPFYEKALEIKQKTLAENHPELATSYNNVGSVYCNMGDFSKALSCHEKALNIRQKTLPLNHPDFAMSFGHMGMVYSKLGDHQKAVTYCERALKIVEQSLPPNHPNLQVYRKNLESARKKL